MINVQKIFHILLKMQSCDDIYKMRKDLYRQIRDESIENILKIICSREKSSSQTALSVLKHTIELKFTFFFTIDIKYLSIILTS